jgi:hypothetical protein
MAAISWNLLSWAASCNVSAGNKRNKNSMLPLQKSEQIETIS